MYNYRDGPLCCQDDDLEVYTTAFNSFDVDGSGKISFGEVGNLIRQVSDREPYESETQEVSSSLNKDLIWEKRYLHG